MEPPGTKWETGVAWLPLGNFWGMLEFVKGSLLRGKRPLRGESTSTPSLHLFFHSGIRRHLLVLNAMCLRRALR